MSNSRNAAIFAASFLGIFAFVGAGCQRKPQVPSKDEKAFIALQNAETTLNDKVRQDPALAANAALYVQGYNGAISSPLKVRGGSMTVFAKKAWIGNAGDTHPDGTPTHPYCTTLSGSEASYIIMSKLREPDGAAIAPDPLNDVVLPMTIKIYGHVPTDRSGKTASVNGILLTTQPQDCDQTSGTSVTLTVFGTNGSLYPADLPSDNMSDRRGNKRFLDNSCTGIPTATGQGDRDLCERMAKIEIYYNNTTGTGTANHTLTCLDGECEVQLGKPQ